MDEHGLKLFRTVGEIDERTRGGPEIWRTWRCDLAVATDDDSVGMMPGMAPTPHDGFPEHHERGNLIEHVVHPGRLERGTMTGFMPARIGRRAVDRPIDEETRHRPPCSPRHIAKRSG